MVPGSTLRYGSSFCRETLRWRALRMFPIEAAVMPLPSEETTPPVTKTYFDIDDLQGGFSNLTGSDDPVNISAARPYTFGSAFGSSTTSLVSYSPEDAWTESFGWGSPAVSPISFRNLSIGSSWSLRPGMA